MAQDDYYKLLGISRDSPDREVKRAYYNLARDLHPDKAATPEDAKRNSEQLGLISQAYNTLKDPKKRADYDASLKGKPLSPGASAPRPSAPAAAPAAPPAAGAAPAGAAAPAAAAAAPPQQSSSPDASAQKTALAQRAFVRGMQFFKEGEFDKARPFFEAAIQNDPVNEPHYHHKYAICLSRAKGGFTKAVDAALKACEMDVYNLEFKLTLGEIYENAGVPTKAQQVYEDVLKWDPDNTKAKNKLKFVIEANRKVGFLEKHMPSLFGKKG